MPGKYEVVISGISGKFPECKSFHELETNLFGKVNMVGENNSRWEPGALNVPPHIGKLTELWELDNTFFGINSRLSDTMDPVARLGLQASYEAICDAGLNPSELSGTQTAVFMSSSSSDAEYTCINTDKKNNLTLLGISKCFQSNRISNMFNLQGPSIMFESAQTGGLVVINEAYNLIASGAVSAAIVGASGIASRPEVSVHYQGMSKLTNGNKTKSFSGDADGFNRSECCVVFLMQRADHAKRSYGTIKNILNYNAGSRNTYFPDYCKDSLTKLIQTVYQQCGIDPSSVGYVEADGTAIKGVDAVELNSLCETFCENRTSPLLVGSIKSSLGHTEEANVFASMAKAIIVLRTGKIPPNLHYTSPNPDVPALVNGKIKVVTETSTLQGDIVGINVMGLSGSYGHIILQQNSRKMPFTTNISILPEDGIPRLVALSGRDEAKLLAILKQIENMPLYEDYIALIHQVFRKDIYKHLYRGYTVLDGTISTYREIKPYLGGKKRPVWFIFSGMGSQWPEMGTKLLQLPVFAESVYKSHKILIPKGIDLINVITNPDESIFNDILNSFVGIAAIQIGLVDVLNTLGVEADGLLGHSVGELGCSYADGCLTAEQTILCAYSRGMASKEANLPKGVMSAVGMGYNQIKDEIPSSINVACHNSKDSCTLSGPTKEMEAFISTIKQRGIFAKLVNVSNIAFHSQHVAPAGPILKKFLDEVIPNPKPRSGRWISTSVPEENWNSDLAKYCSSEYHTYNLLNSVLFEEGSKHIPSDAICIEIAPHGLLQAILRRSLNSECTQIPLTNRSNKDGLVFLLTALGRMYNSGIDMDLSTIYPAVEFPVSRETPYINSLLTWDFTNTKTFDFYGKVENIYSYKNLTINLSGEDQAIYSDLKIHDRMVIPPANYLETVMDMFRKMNHQQKSLPLIFKKINLEDHLKILPKGDVNLCAQLQRGTGEFEIVEEKNNKVVSNGQIGFHDLLIPGEAYRCNENMLVVNRDEIYKFLANKGLQYGPTYQNINSIMVNDQGFKCKINWTRNWTVFLETLISSVNFYDGIRHGEARVAKDIQSIIIAPAYYETKTEHVVDVSYEALSKVLTCPGLQIINLQTRALDVCKKLKLAFASERFTPYNNLETHIAAPESLRITLQLLKEDLDNIDGCRGGTMFLKLVYNGNNYLKDIMNMVDEIFGKQMNFLSAPSDAEYEHLKSQNVVIIADEFNHEKAVKILQNVEGYLLTTVKLDPSALSKAKLSLVGNQNGVYFLFKKETPIIPQLHVIFTTDIGWEDDLREKLDIYRGKENARVYLVSTTPYLTTMRTIINKFKGFKNLRFVFIDQKAPKFNINLPFYKDWLVKDMKVNVYRNRSWGSIQETRILEYNASTKVNILELKQVLLENNRLSCIGLNLKDVSGVSRSCDKFGALDYVEVLGGSADVCGVCYLSEGHSTARDPELCWKIPKSWSHHEAVTVPVPYSLAYMIMVVLGEAQKGQSVLVHAGYSPVSFAAIRVALSIGCKVFTTYSTKKQHDFIRTSFPKISHDQIICSTNINFVGEIIAANKGKQLDIVLNVYSGEIFQKSQELLMQDGQFFHMGTDAMNKGETLGMHMFLHIRSFYGINSSNLQSFKKSLKKQLWQAVSHGIETGVVVPLSYESSSNVTTNEAAVKVLKKMQENDEFKRLVLSLNNTTKIQRDIFICDPTKTYLIIGDQNELWFAILEWLLMRGAQRISLMPLQTMSELNSYRLEKMCSKYEFKGGHIIETKEKDMKSKDFELLLKQISAPIAATFFTSFESVPFVKEINEALKSVSPKSKYVSFSEGSGTFCERRHNDGYPTFHIVLKISISSMKKLVASLDDILQNKAHRFPIIHVSENNGHTYSGLNAAVPPLHVLPDDWAELTALTNESDVCGFEEVPTRSCLLESTKEMSPVFIIPGLRPILLRELVSRLMHPALQAKIPNTIESIERVAQILVQDLLKFKMKLFTLISADWGGALALTLGRLLEQNGRKATIILLDSSPTTIQSLLARERLDQDTNLINKYFPVPITEIKQLERLSSFDEKLNTMLSEEDYAGYSKAEITNGFHVLRNRVHAILNFKPTGVKFGGYNNLLRLKDASLTDKCGLTEYCSGRIFVNTVEEKEYEGMLRSWATCESVNDMVLHESRHVVNYLDFYHHDPLLQDFKFSSPGIERI